MHATPHGDLGTILERTAEGDGKNQGGTSPPGLSISAETRTRFGVDLPQSREWRRELRRPFRSVAVFPAPPWMAGTSPAATRVGTANATCRHGRTCSGHPRRVSRDAALPSATDTL